MHRGLIPVLLCLLSVTGPLAATAQAPAGAPPRVSVAAAVMEPVVQSVRFIGRVEAINSVDLVARVTGFLRRVDIRDGATVAAGDLLFEIEPDQYEAILAAREADVTQAEANLALAMIELDRRTQLVARDATPQSELDIARANEQVARAALVSANAARQQAELDLSYTRITAPFDGRIGRLQGSVGELVSPNSAPLATVVSQAPMFVSFSPSERQMTDVMQNAVAAGESPSAPSGRLTVSLSLPNGTDLGETGTIAFVDNRVDPRTGTLAVRAEFENADRLLVDGSFVNVRLAEDEAEDMLTVPQAAVQRDQRGSFVLVVGADNTVEQRYIVTGTQVGISIVVSDGLTEGETVIIEGLQRVRPGVPVEPVLAGGGN